jgi:hypothetical protein
MPATVQSIVEAAITELSQVPGASTQIYATPRILQYVTDTFDMVFQQNWWAAYTSFWTGTLSGTTGLLTADIVPIQPNTAGVPIISHTNIRACFVDGSSKIIRSVPPRMNPNLFNDGTGTTAIYSTPDYTFPNRPIRFYPATATGDIILEVRQEPLHPFALTDTLYLDAMMLMLGTCYMYAADDGTNPGQINKFQSMFTKRLTDMISAENQDPLQLDPRFGVAQDQWWEMTL